MAWVSDADSFKFAPAAIKMGYRPEKQNWERQISASLEGVGRRILAAYKRGFMSPHLRNGINACQLNAFLGIVSTRK